MAAARTRPLPIEAIPVRHPGRWIASGILLLLAAMAVNNLLTNPRWRWDTFATWLFADVVLEGLWTTIWITIVAMIIGIGLGIVLAVMRMSPNPVVSTVAWLYIWFFRGTPVLVQIMFWAYLGALFEDRIVSLGIPFGTEFLFFDVNTLIPVIIGGVLALGLNEAAYMAEIVRSGIMSVGKGQTEAAEALGMSRGKVMRRIVLPQAMRIIIPPTGNEVISMLKTSSLLFAVSIMELFTTVQTIYSANYQRIPLLLVACFWYIAATSVLSVGQHYLEKRFGRGVAGSRQQRAKRRLATMGPA